MDSELSVSKRRSPRIAWIIFSVGIAFAPIAWIVWMGRVGVSWWMAYDNGGSVGQTADHIKAVLCMLGMVICASAPFFSSVPFRRKLFFAVLALGSAAAANYLSGLIMILFVSGV